MNITLEVTARDAKTAPETVRSLGMLPAVIYGSKEASTPIQIPMPAFERIWKTAGETSVITLKGLDDEKETLIHDVQFHPVTGKALHADFYVIEKGQKVTVAIPIEFVGTAPAEKAGHVLVRTLHELEIEVTPAQLPHSFEVDISGLAEIGDNVKVGDIKLPSSATTTVDPEEVVVTIAAAKEEPVVEAPAVEGAAPTHAELEEKAAEESGATEATE